tara:strand:- start:1103 stop:1948 length:846 start_codon:yes stop_codon:yes gene_type:complete
MSNKVNAIVLAGIPASKDKRIKEENKALLELNNIPLCLYVVQALQNSESISRIGIVGPKKELEKIILNRNEIKIINQSLAPKESRRFIENCINGHNNLSKNGEKTLFTPCDLPFIKSQDIDNFILEAEKYNAAFHYGVINVNNIPKEIELLKKCRKSLFKGEGDYRTAGLFLFDGTKIKNREPLEYQLERAFPMRRTSSFLSKVILYSFLAKKFRKEIFKYLTHTLTRKNIEDAVEDKLGFSFKLTDVESARAIVDIDDIEEYEFIKKHFDYLSEELDSKY